MSQQILISVKCPNCQQSLMNDSELLDNLPVIELEAKINEKVGKILLGQEYGSYNKKFVGVDSDEKEEPKEVIERPEKK